MYLASSSATNSNNVSASNLDVQRQATKSPDRLGASATQNGQRKIMANFGKGVRGVNKSNLFDPRKQLMMAEKVGAMRVVCQRDSEISPSKIDKQSSFFHHHSDLSNNIFVPSHQGYSTVGSAQIR